MSELKKLYVFVLLALTTALLCIAPYFLVEPTNISFFASGNGNADIFVAAFSDDTNHSDKNVRILLKPEPELLQFSFRKSNIEKIVITYSNYSGTATISDIYVSGKHISDIEINGDNSHILNSSSDNTIFSSAGSADITICDKCNIKKPEFLLPLLAATIMLPILLVFGLYLLRNKIKQKLASTYTFKNYALIFPYFKPYWARTLLAILITIPVGSMDAVIAWSLKPFMDVVLVEKQSGWTMYIPLMIIIFSILQALFTYLATYMNTWVGSKIALTIKYDLFCKLQRSEAAVFDSGNSGEIIFRYHNDADSSCSGLLNSMRVFTTRLFSSISLIAVLLYNSWQLAIVAIIVMFGALLPLTKVKKRLGSIVSADANALASLLNRYNEVFNGNRVITAYNLFGYCRKRFIAAINNLFNLHIQMVVKTGVISPVMHVISSFGIAFVIWYGSYLIVTHQITAGNFASFITSLVMLYNPLKSIAANYNSVIMSLMSVERVFEKLQHIPAIRNDENAPKLTDCQGNIQYKNVCFEYVDGKPVLKNVNLDIKAGQTFALVGNSGGGKTTVTSLLPRFYDVKSGSITVDGKDIRDINLDSLRENIAIVFQDNFLFSGTIRENILFGNKDVDNTTLDNALKGACLEEFLSTLDNGLDTQIGERGVMLSGGQRQRIAIARAFIKNAPILILDEATSALDNKSEAVVQQAIDNLMKNRNVIVIAHRLSTVRNADCIAVINNGEVVEIGKHDDLVNAGGTYAALYKTQL